jgi:hypothetical protein
MNTNDKIKLLVNSTSIDIDAESFYLFLQCTDWLMSDGLPFDITLDQKTKLVTMRDFIEIALSQKAA